MLLSLAILGDAAAQAPPQVDPLRSGDCIAALERLDTLRDARSRNAASAREVEIARTAAARLCLGAATPAPRAGRSAPAASPAVAVPAAPPPFVPASPPPPPVELSRPTVITHCDASGCWAADGTGLRRIPAPALPPAGPCALVGGLLHCP